MGYNGGWQPTPPLRIHSRTDLLLSQDKHEIPAAGLLESALRASMEQREQPGGVGELLRALCSEALAGTVSFDRNTLRTIENLIGDIDRRVSKQLAVIMHHPQFQALERRWRGLNYLVFRAETGPTLRVRVLHCDMPELQADLGGGVAGDACCLQRKLAAEFDHVGGEPLGVLVGDYLLANTPTDIALLGRIAQLAAAMACPFISAVAPEFFGCSDWDNFAELNALPQHLRSDPFADWRAFRARPESRFVFLTLPEVLVRLPFGSLRTMTKIEEFNFQEFDERSGTPRFNSAELCWMNSADLFATRLAESFAATGWCTDIRGAEGGGRVDGLPLFMYRSDEGDMTIQCPTRFAVNERREMELSSAGFIPLVFYRGTDAAVFFQACTAHHPPADSDPEAGRNDQIAAQVPWVMVASRFALGVILVSKQIARRAFTVGEFDAQLNRWLARYTDAEVPRAGNPLVFGAARLVRDSEHAERWAVRLSLQPHLSDAKMTEPRAIVVPLPWPLNPSCQ